MSYQKMTKAQLIEKLESLTDKYEEAVKRGDEFFDELEQYKDGSHPDSTLIDHDELKSLNDQASLINDVADVQFDIKDCILRQAMGVQTYEDLNELIMKFLEMDL
jgi:hypothetical protein